MAIFTIKDVAELFKVSEDVIEELASKNKIEGFYVGGVWRTTESKLDEYIESAKNAETSMEFKKSADKKAVSELKCQHNNLTQKEVNVMRLYFTTDKKSKSKKLIAQLVIKVPNQEKPLRKSKRVSSEAEGRAWAEEFLKDYDLYNQSDISQIVTGITLGKNPTLQEYLEHFLASGFGNGSSKTRKGYYDSARPIINEIGNYRLKDLSFELIKRMFNSFRDKYVQSGLDKQFLVLNKAIKKAYLDKLIDDNFMVGFFDEYGRHNNEYPTSNKQRPPVVGWTGEEIEMLLGAAKDYPEVYPILLLLNATGMRPAELRGLRWDKIDWDEKCVTIDQRIVSEYKNLSTSGTGKVTEVSKSGVKTSRSRGKNGKVGERELPLSDEVLDTLREWQAYVQDNEEYKFFKDSAYVFPSRNGYFLTETALKNRMARFIRSSGLEDKVHFTLYKFRHSFCTRMAENGASLALTMQMMGDKSSDIVLHTYTNIEKRKAREYARKYLK